ncbi:MAG TPA: dynamin family protein [Streptosporangiaceae bacterium]|nr:dynamin family protein [Streptosporangiaceae bacterium]
MVQMDGLTSYQQRRLELADMIRALLPVAHAHGDERRKQEIRALLARLAAGRFQLAVIGQFSRGKTTLMNALLGEAYLPMGALPMTSVVTIVRYGTRTRALVRSHASALPVEVPVTEVARFVARASAERTRMQVASVEVEIPAELLRLGFEFVDTPGVGSAIAANTAATLRYLPQADAIVFVTGFDSALTSAEADFLTRSAGQAGRLFVVINKRDLVTDADAASVTSYVRRWIRDHLRAEPPVFATSALQALNGAMAGNAGVLADSGIEPLRDALSRFLTAQQGRAALGAITAAAAGLVTRQQQDLQAGQVGRDGRPEHDSIVAGFESRVSELRDQVAAVAARIASTADTAATAVLAERLPAWKAGLSEILAPAAAPSGAAVAPVHDPASGVLDAVRLAGRQAAADWLERCAAELREALIMATAEDIGTLLDLARSTRQLGTVLAGMPALDLARAGWAAEEIPQLILPVVNWIVPERPAGRRAHRGRVNSQGAEARAASSAVIDAAVADFGERAGLALSDAAADWAQRTGEQARRQVSEEAAQFRRYLSDPPYDHELAALANLAGQLAAFRDSLAAWLPDNTGLAASPDTAPDAALSAGIGGTCAVCDRLEAAQAEYLARRQFLLATSEADQARHAETGGFCPLHTWQYAHLASPVGISAGNARLARRLAGALREAEAISSDQAELAGHVAALAGTRACPACAVLAVTERDAVAELAERALPAEPPRLCLRHLALVLDHPPSLPAGRAMTASLVVALQRASENMRAYALKREALRRGLITADEASAYSDALRLIAGQPALALPAPPE